MPSNINQANYFELRLTEEVCSAKKLEFKYVNEIQLVHSRIRESFGSEAPKKMREQELRLETGLPVFLRQVVHFERRRDIDLSGVNWVGGGHRGARVADIDLHFRNITVPVSVKSVKRGQGTDRNLGGDSMRQLIGYDSEPLQEKMRAEVVQQLTNQFPGSSFGDSLSSLKKAIESDDDSKNMIRISSDIGKRYQIEHSRQLLQAANRATQVQKRNLMEYLALQADPRDKGLVIFVNRDNSAEFKSPLLISRTATMKIQQKSQSRSGALCVLIDGIHAWDIQINATNGIGRSPIAFRVFSRI